MTSIHLFRLLIRRWYLVIVGLALTLVVLWPATHRPGVYWAQVNVVLLPPTTEYYPNKLEDPQFALSALASLIVSDFNGAHQPTLMASSVTTLYGEGRTSGVEVRMPNSGNQWKPLYPSATIDVQAVDSSPDGVTDQITSVTARLKDLLADRQDALGVDPTVRVSLISSPVDPSVYYVTGSRMRALGAGGIVGLAVTVAGVYWFERLLTARRARALAVDPEPPSVDGVRRRSAQRRRSGATAAGRVE